MDDKRAVELRASAQTTLQTLQAGEHVRQEAKRLSRTAKHYVWTMQGSHEAAAKFHEELQNFGFKEGQRDEHVSACGVALAQLESLYYSLVTSLTSVFVEQIDKLVQSEEKVNISDAKEKLITSRRQVDVALRKLLEHKAEKTDNDPKTQKALEDGLKTLDDHLAEGTRKADLWDKAARQEIYAALAAYMRLAYNNAQKSTACMRGWDSRLEGDRRGSIAVRGVSPSEKPDSPPPLKQGYVFVKVGQETSWNLRWFVLDAPQQGGHFHLYKSWHTDNAPLVSIDCALLSVRPQSEEQKQKGLLDLQSPRVALQLKTSSAPHEIDDLVEQLKTTIAAQLANVSAAGATKARVDPARNMAILQSLREASAANNVCVDCSAPAPEWAAINHGVLICIECSGIHRSLGTHISKVRSFTLDNLDPESVEVLKLVGNEKANAVWEHTMPPNYRKPDPSSKRLLKEVYISCKWSERLFVEKVDKSKEQLLDELITAVTHNDVVAAARLLALKADPTGVVPGNKRHLLHLAVEAKASTLIELLVQNGADPQQGDADGVSPLALAIRSGSIPLATLLFSRISSSLSRDRAKLLEAAEETKDPQVIALVNDRVGPESPVVPLVPADNKAAAPEQPLASSGSPRRKNPGAATRSPKEATKSPERVEEKPKEKEEKGDLSGRFLRRITSLRGTFLPGDKADKAEKEKEKAPPMQELKMAPEPGAAPAQAPPLMQSDKEMEKEKEEHAAKEGAPRVEALAETDNKDNNNKEKKEKKKKGKKEKKQKKEKTGDGPEKSTSVENVALVASASSSDKSSVADKSGVTVPLRASPSASAAVHSTLAAAPAPEAPVVALPPPTEPVPPPHQEAK